MSTARTAYFFYRLRNDNYIREFCVANWSDPRQYVETPAPDGTTQRWDRRSERGMLVFRAPDGYSGGPIGWVYDRELQRGVAAPRDELERLAIDNRYSVVMTG